MPPKTRYHLPPPVITLIFMAMMGAVRYGYPALYQPFSARIAISMLFVSLGILICLSAAVTLRRAHTTLSPIHPAATSTLVTWGIYRISRNPIYTGLLCILVGWGVWLAHPINIIFLLAFIACINRFQIIPEEQALTVKFGSTFTQYTEQTRRWI